MATKSNRTAREWLVIALLFLASLVMLVFFILFLLTVLLGLVLFIDNGEATPEDLSSGLVLPVPPGSDNVAQIGSQPSITARAGFANTRGSDLIISPRCRSEQSEKWPSAHHTSLVPDCWLASSNLGP